MTPAQRAYEEKRAAKAGMTLDRWLADKKRQAERAARDQAKGEPAPAPVKPSGMIGRLLERARRPFPEKR